MGRQFRKKPATLSFADDEGDGEAVPPPPKAAPAASYPATVAILGSVKPKDAKKTLLSFDEGEEALPLPKERKGGSFGRGAASQGAAAPASRGPSTQTAAPGEYSAERMRELAGQTRRFPGGKQPSAAVPVSVQEPAFRLKGGFKPAAAAKPESPKAILQTIVVRGDSEDEAEPMLPPPNLPPPTRRPPGGQVPSHPPPMGSHGGRMQDTKQPLSQAAVKREPVSRGDDGSGFIAPDADTIRRAKERRERLRFAAPAPNYVPLGTGAGLGPEAALEAPVKADKDASDDDEEDDGRLRTAFIGGGGLGNPGGGVFGGLAADSQEVAEADDDNDESWKAQQLSRSMGPLGAAQLPAAGSSAEPRPPSAGRTPPPGGLALAPRGQQAAQVAANGDRVLEVLHQGLHQIQAARTRAQQELARTQGNLADALEATTRLENGVADASVKYGFLQEIRAYIADLCDMLQAKAPIVEELEDELLGVQAQAAAAYNSRVQADEEAEEAIASAGVTAALGVLSRGGALAAARNAADTAAKAAQGQTELATGPSGGELDEFGRDVGLERRMEASSRAVKRDRRRAGQAARALQQRQGQDNAKDLAGLETTDESEDEVSHVDSRRREILQASEQVFADADDEYAKLETVKARLATWQEKYPTTFRDAYGAASAPALFAPFVRLQLLHWDPLRASDQGFDSQPWYAALFDFELGSSAGAGNGSAGGDSDLVPQLVTQVVARRAKHMLAHTWHPYSARSSKRAAAVLGDLMAYMPADSPVLQEMLRQAEARLQVAAAAVKLPPWPSAATAACVPAEVLLARRFGKLCRLLASLAAFSECLPSRSLQAIALQRIIPQAVPYIRAAASQLPLAVQRLEQVSQALPQAWLHNQAAVGLVEVCKSLARNMERSKPSSQDKAAGRKLSILLVVMGLQAEAKQLASLCR